MLALSLVNAGRLPLALSLVNAGRLMLALSLVNAGMLVELASVGSPATFLAVELVFVESLVLGFAAEKAFV